MVNERPLAETGRSSRDQLLYLSSAPARAESLGVYRDRNWPRARPSWKPVSTATPSGRSPLYLGRRPRTSRLSDNLYYRGNKLIPVALLFCSLVSGTVTRRIPKRGGSKIGLSVAGSLSIGREQ